MENGSPADTARMARSHLAAAIASLLALAGAGSALGARSASYQGAGRGCKSAHNSSFHGSKCQHGKRHRGPGKGAHLLFYTAKDGHCPDATLAPTLTRRGARARRDALPGQPRTRRATASARCTGTSTSSPPPRRTREHGVRRLLRTRRPARADAGDADAPHRLHLELAGRLRSRREHRLGQPLARHPQVDRRDLDVLGRAPREHPRPRTSATPASASRRTRTASHTASAAASTRRTSASSSAEGRRAPRLERVPPRKVASSIPSRW